MWEKEARRIKRKLFWRCLLQGAYINNLRVRIVDDTLKPIGNLRVFFEGSINKKTLYIADLAHEPISKTDISYWVKYFSVALLKYKKKQGGDLCQK